tara:strand:- start:2907 stop:3389 length:483 start_codon:yes stop_codon:yes gene_type:complete
MVKYYMFEIYMAHLMKLKHENKFATGKGFFKSYSVPRNNTIRKKTGTCNQICSTSQRTAPSSCRQTVYKTTQATSGHHYNKDHNSYNEYIKIKKQNCSKINNNNKSSGSTPGCFSNRVRNAKHCSIVQHPQLTTTQYTDYLSSRTTECVGKEYLPTDRCQ